MTFLWMERAGRSTRLGLLWICLAGAACDRSAPQPPTLTPPSGVETIANGARIGWEQRARDAVEIAAIRYALYVDGARSDLANASCGTTATEAGYACSAVLPQLTAGAHTLEIAALVMDGALLESPRSAALRVVVTSVTSASTPSGRGTASTGSAPGLAAPDSTPWPANTMRLADGFERPADLAIAPDGRILVAERSGRVRVVDGGVLADEAALVIPGAREHGAAVVAIALDPQFARTHFVFAIYTARSPSGTQTFTLARFREAANTLGDRIPILDDIPASADPHAALRFGPDARLYAAFDDGGEEAAADDPARLNGKILRLNPDGTTPRDQPRGSPVVADGLRSPRGLDWHRPSGRLWSADAQRVGAIRWTPPPASIAVSGEDLHVATQEGIRRARIDPLHPDRLDAEVDLVRGLPVRVIAIGVDGVLYFVTDRALGRLR